jgi:rare lipoprotein A
MRSFLSVRAAAPILALCISLGCAHAPRREPPESVGLASWYGARHAGRRTANGERFDPSALTAAHRTLPFGSRVRVTNLENGRSVVVRINDRGPFAEGRLVDLSEAAARAIGMAASGVARIRLEVVE